MALGSAHQTIADAPGRILVMLSGGGDSVALLDIAVRAKGAREVEAVHVNYGLRPEAALDQLHCERLCDRFGVRLHVQPVTLRQQGNLHANARAERYRVARRVARERGLDWIATAHTADDEAETVLYRLASSPGRRALCGIAERDGDLIRPLLSLRREELRAHLVRRGIDWREDSSNADARFARTRVRALLADLAAVHPAAVANINATARELRLEEAAVRALVAGQLDRVRAPDGTISVAEFARWDPAVAALALRELAEAATGRATPAARHRVADLIAPSARGGTRLLDLGAGAVAEIAYGRFRVRSGDDAKRPDPAPTSVDLGAPGAYEFGAWHIDVATRNTGEPAGTTSADRPAAAGRELQPVPVGPFAVELDLPSRSEHRLIARSRRRGDRLRPRGLGGTKSLQDLFVDRKVPRAMRDTYPVVCWGDEIVWVPGVAIGETLPGHDRDPAVRPRPVGLRLIATLAATGDRF